MWLILLKAHWAPLYCLISIMKSPNTPKTLLAALSTHQKLTSNGLFRKSLSSCDFQLLCFQLSIPNRTECLSDLIQTATSSEFCPSVTRLLVQDNIKTKNRRQNQLEKIFFNFLSFSLLSFEQQAICFQTDLKLNPKFHIHQLPSKMSYHTQK